jgi:hypothetical protein
MIIEAALSRPAFAGWMREMRLAVSWNSSASGPKITAFKASPSSNLLHRGMDFLLAQMPALASWIRLPKSWQSIQAETIT